MKQDMQRISFYGKQIMTTEVDGVHYVAMKPVCENIGLQWAAQRKRIIRSTVLNSTVSIMDTVAEDGKERKMLMLPIKYMQGWLFSVDENRVKPEIKDKLVAYQRECFEVLNKYWLNKSVMPVTTMDDSTAACSSNLHVFLEITRGRMHTSTLGNPYNSVSMPTALVLEYLYNRPDSDKEMRVSSKAIGHELKIACNTARRAIGRMSSWGFLIKKSSPGQMLWVRLNISAIDQALELSKNSLLSNQQQVGYLPSHVK